MCIVLPQQFPSLVPDAVICYEAVELAAEWGK